MPDPLGRLSSPLSLLALSMSKLGRGAGGGGEPRVGALHSSCDLRMPPLTIAHGGSPGLAGLCVLLPKASMSL